MLHMHIKNRLVAIPFADIAELAVEELVEDGDLGTAWEIL